MQTLTKKKVRDAISFPMTIDMRPFIEPKPPGANTSATTNATSTETSTATNTNTTTTDNNANTTPITVPTNMEIEPPATNESAPKSPVEQQPSPTTSTPADSEPPVRVTRSQTKQQNPPPPPPSSAPSTAPSDNDEYIYELTSVMMHRGMTAYGGHYVVHVKDEWYANRNVRLGRDRHRRWGAETELYYYIANLFSFSTGKWWQFNDEEVKPIEEAKVGVIDDTAYDSSASSSTTETAPTPIDVDVIASETAPTPPSPSKKKAAAKGKGKSKKTKGKGKGKDEKEQEDEDSGEGEKEKNSQDKGYYSSPHFLHILFSKQKLYRRISSTMAYMLTYARRVRPILSASAPDKTIVESIGKEMDTLKTTAQEYNK